MPKGKQILSSFDSMLVELQSQIFSQFGGPRVVKLRHIINTFKGLTFLWVLFLMNVFNNYSTGMYLYLFLHGTYGIFWVAKDITFPDFKFNVKAKLGSSILCFLFLVLYWLIPVPLAAGYGVNQPSKARIVFLVTIYLTGLVLMLGSDYQKYHALKRKPGLISDGFFKYSRNPNYLGQILIYSSFVHCSGHLVGAIQVYGLACILFTLNIYLKDATSYKFKEGWEEYRKQSSILLFKVFSSPLMNFIFYAVVFGCIGYFLYSQLPEKYNDFSFSHVFGQKIVQEQVIQTSL